MRKIYHRHHLTYQDELHHQQMRELEMQSFERIRDELISQQDQERLCKSVSVQEFEKMERLRDDEENSAEKDSRLFQDTAQLADVGKLSLE